MHDLAFADAARPLPASVLGLQLRTYSVGHELRLLAERNALGCLSEDEFNALPLEQRIYALKRAVLICSTDWQGYEQATRTSRLNLFWVPIRLKLRLDRWVSLWGLATEKADWPVEMAEFRNYLRAGRQTIPALSSAVPEDAEAYEIANKGEKLGDGRGFGSPLLAQLINFIGDHPHTFGLNRSVLVQDVPFAYAMNLMFAHYEEQGGLFIENAREAQVRWEMAEHRAAVKREKAERAAAEATAAAKTEPDQPSPNSDSP